jgi:hypothetical protein
MQEKDFTIRDGKWVQRTYIKPTAEQLEILSQINQDGESEEQKAIIKEIKDNSFIEASDEEILKLQAIYDANFLQGSSLIDVDITLPDGRGIINCRLGTEHKQIRF